MIKDVVGFPDYEISSFGTVTNKVTGHQLKPFWQYKKPNQFLSVTLYRDGKGSNRFVANLVWETFWHSIDRKYMIIHKDGDRSNCAFTNLDLVVRNRTNQGDLRNQAIFALEKLGFTHSSIAVILRVNVRTIRNILAGKRYG